MVKVWVTAVILLVCIGVADAAPKRKVRVETQPVGAIVYIETKENGPECQPTPCAIELPVGETAIIIELPGYNTEFKTVIVPKRGKVKFADGALGPLTLDPAVGTLVIAGPAGASISVNGEDKGRAPAKIDVSADTHKVVITKGGKTVFDAYVDVPSGNEIEVEVASLGSGVATKDDDIPEEGGGDVGETGGDGGEITKTAPGTVRPPIISAAAAMSIGFRKFTYENNQSPGDLRDESESGQVILGPLIEIWPGSVTNIKWLRGLSFVGRFQFRLNEQPVTGGGITGSLSTFWQSLEVSGRYRLTFAEKYGVELGVGWTSEQYRFNGSPMDKELVPDAQYKSIRLGVRGSVSLADGMFEPFLELENRFVSDGGPMQTRWGASTSVGGLRAALGVIARRGGFHVRAEAALLRYSWDFENKGDLMAAGGTDVITLLGFYVGYAY